MTEELFPIMGIGYNHRQEVAEIRAAGVGLVVIGIPWNLIASHEKQADHNHGQTLKRLADRGGLGPDEALAVLENRRWHSMPHYEAHRKLAALLLLASPLTGPASDGVKP